MVPPPGETGQILGVKGHEESIADEDVVLHGGKTIGDRRQTVPDDQGVIVTLLHLGELAPVEHVLDFEGVEAEVAAERSDVGLGELGDVQPDPAFGGPNLVEAVCRDLHGGGRTGRDMEEGSHPTIIAPAGIAAPFLRKPKGRSRRRSHMKKLALLAVLLSVFAGACSREARQLDAARDRWEASGITSYRYDIVVRCFCQPIDAAVEVDNGAVISVTPLTDGAITLDGRTIEQLFADLEAELAADGRGDYTIAYHPDLGYPMRVVADPIKAAIDDEYIYEILLITR